MSYPKCCDEANLEQDILLIALFLFFAICLFFLFLYIYIFWGQEGN